MNSSTPMIRPEELQLNYKPLLPLKKHPIIIIGAGGIVKDAHLPAYKIAGFEVYGIYDADFKKANLVATEHHIPHVFKSVEELVDKSPQNVVYDIALPASAIAEILEKLPANSSVLMQKPMGDDLIQANAILEICRTKTLKAAVNFQLRYAPFMLAARDIINKGLIGKLCDIEFNINVFTPWQLWQFMYNIPRVEISYHSIHYIDCIRSLLGNPINVFGKTTKHPNSPGLASVRSDIIMDYGDYIRANIHTNHNHNFGLHNQHAYVKLEGTKGAIKIKLGLLMDYPTGVEDKFEFISIANNPRAEWKEIILEGSWFPHAFIGSMAQVMCFAEGSSDTLDNSVEDVIYTMQNVESAYVKLVNP